jgi:ABC-2 type transport system ATP-binding protein
MTAIIETFNLTKDFNGYKAVNDISLTINQGDIYGLIGRNGAGKTTFMKIISNLSNPTSGSYKIFGYDNKNLHQAQTRISSLIENVGAYPNMTAQDNLLLKGKAMGLVEDKYIKESLELLGISKVGKKKVKDFSLGMKQRLGIALAMVGDPDILILDEPINGLDPQGIIDIRNIIEKLNREKNMTFLISSHILDELSKIATHFAIIDHGNLIANFSKKELEENNRDRIELITNNPQKTCTIFDQRGLTSYKLVDDDKFYIYQGTEKIDRIITMLKDMDIKIDYISVHEASLEDYYMNLSKN